MPSFPQQAANLDQGRLQRGQTLIRDANNNITLIDEGQNFGRNGSRPAGRFLLTPEQVEAFLSGPSADSVIRMIGDDSVPTVQEQVLDTVSQFIGGGATPSGSQADLPPNVQAAQTANFRNQIFGNPDPSSGIAQPPSQQFLNLLNNQTDLPPPIPITREQPAGLQEQNQANLARKLAFMTQGGQVQFPPPQASLQSPAGQQRPNASQTLNRIGGPPTVAGPPNARDNGRLKTMEK